MCVSITTQRTWIYSPSTETKAQENRRHNKDLCEGTWDKWGYGKWDGCVRSLCDL